MSFARISMPATPRAGSLPGAWAAHLAHLSKRVSGASIIAFGLLLAACGGGGGGGSGGGGGATYTLSGTVTGANSVSVALSGAATATSTTDTNGVYSFTGLSNGSFTITPTKTGYTFNPVSLTTTVTNANVTAQNFTATANTASTYTLSGTVTGPWVEKVRVALSGAASGTTLTDANGTYTFANLAAGTYTVTPALPGYNYSPAAPSVTVGANATQNFVASSAISGNTLSGTISYPGSKTGKVIVRVYDSCCLQQSSVAGTSIDLTSGSGTYAVRGLGGSSYVVTAEMDTLGTGEPNAANPAAASGTITFATSNLTQPLTLTDPDPAAIAPVAPSSLRIYAESGSAFVFYSPALNASRQERATSYTVSWGTDTNASTGGGSQTFHAQGANQAVSWITGLPNTPLYFKMTASIGAATSAPTSVVGPVTIGPTTGANTVSGTVSFPGAATGPLYVGLLNSTTGVLYYASIANPGGVGSASYIIAGVPNGSYQHVAIIDQNGNHIIDAGDLNNTQGRPPTLVVSGDTTANLTLSGANASAAIATNFYSTDGLTGNYGANGLVSGIIKRIVGVTLYSAPNTRVPFDAPLGSGNEFALSGGNAAPPTTADVYAFRVRYSDGTTEDITASPASPILGASALPTNPSVNVAAPNTRTVPQFDWTAPASPPTSYEYFISVGLASGGQVWYYPNNGVGMPSSQKSVVFNTDGSANPSSLAPTNTYRWSLSVRDLNTRNSAQLQAPNYIP